MIRAYIMAILPRAKSAAGIVAQLGGVPGVEFTVTRYDHERHGIWPSCRALLELIAVSGKPGLMLQDDVILNVEALNKHLPTLVGHLETYGLISLFTPPQKLFTEKAAQGFNAQAGNAFLWAQCYLIGPRFAEQTIRAARSMDESLTGGFDEVHFRFASQLYDVPLLTLIGSFARHNINLASTHRGLVVDAARQTRIDVTAESDFTEIRPFWNKTKADLAKYLRENPTG